MALSIQGVMAGIICFGFVTSVYALEANSEAAVSKALEKSSDEKVEAGVEGPIVSPKKDDREYFLQTAPDDGKESRFLKENLKEIITKIDPLQVYLGQKVNAYGGKIDAWFGTKQDFDLEKSNRIEMILPLTYYLYDEKFAVNPSFRAKFYFPRTQKKLHLVADSTGDALFGESDQKSNQPKAVVDQKQAQEDFLISLRRTIFENEWFNFAADVGTKFDGITPDPITGFRLRYLLPTYGEHSNYFLQKFYWQYSLGRVADNQYRHDWLLSEPLLLRYSAGLTWWNTDEYWTHGQDLTLYQSINAHRTFSYSLSGSWQQDSAKQGMVNQNYGISYSWRERVYSDWFYAVLTPYGNFRHEVETDKYYFEPSITFSIEAHFFERKKNGE